MTPTSIEGLLECWEKLGKMERLVLSTIARRLLAGQRKFGELTEDKRVWSWEAAEEGLDQSVYLAAGLVALTEASKRRYFGSLDGEHYSVPTGEAGVEQSDRAVLPYVAEDGTHFPDPTYKLPDNAYPAYEERLVMVPVR